MSPTPRPTRVYLVRHGETDWNARGLLQGTADVALNARGEAQARALGARLRGVAFDAAYTSDLRRARRTADVVLGAGPVAAAVVPSLRELSYGTWQGMTREQWGAEDRALAERWEAAPWSVTFPGGESLDGVLRRAAPAWRRIVDVHRGGCVLLSAHGHVNRVLLTYVLGLPRDRFWSIAQPNGGCTVLAACAADWSAMLLAAA